ncbi:glycoside hydrolase family 68 protein [Quadrisphaera sp. INWT6]|uniref:glycoside hydrolase family 68 protein n=1 Tax=Quadrisphaera sp. INWT6 TaxID=2596917 RepID=UPI0019D662BE|nr:glycoside hydrolase family 68 protein [Quadrisphaera sp. INWT6]
MAYALPEAWVWDFWVVDDGSKYHLFFLYASKALRDPDARHHRASIGHAVSDDMATWERVEDALVRGDGPAFDDLATWTGCTLQGPDGTWFTFYTGATLTEAGNVQSIGLATSDDLVTWDKQGQLLEADPRWYEKLSDGQWHDEAFRDPFVYRDGDQWRMLITARANHGPADDRGVIGTAVSPDLRRWTLEAPLSEPGQGFGQLEVMEVVSLEGQEHLVFNCLASDLSASHRANRHDRRRLDHPDHLRAPVVGPVRGDAADRSRPVRGAHRQAAGHGGRRLPRLREPRPGRRVRRPDHRPGARPGRRRHGDPRPRGPRHHRLSSSTSSTVEGPAPLAATRRRCGADPFAVAGSNPT